MRTMQIQPRNTPRSTVARARRGALGLLAALACAALISACGSSSSSSSSSSSTSGKVNLNTARVEHSIEASILTQRHLSSTVVCPAVVAQEAGVKFECKATVHSAKKKPDVVTPFEVTVTNTKGYVTYVGK
jgi:hypothetical protein